MSKKEYIVLQPKKTIVDVEYSDGTVVRTESRFWYEGEVAHLKFFVDDNKQLAELRKQLEEKDKEIDKLEQELAFYNEEVKNKGTCGLCEKLENREIEDLRRQLAEKDEKIYELKDLLELSLHIDNFDESKRRSRHKLFNNIKQRFAECYVDNKERCKDGIPYAFIWHILDEMEEMENGI